MNEEEVRRNIQEILNRPLIEKVKDLHKGIIGNLELILKDSEDCQDPTEYSRMNGQVWGLTFCRGAIEAILRLEEKRCGCGSLLDEKEKESSSKCMDCKRKVLG